MQTTQVPTLSRGERKLMTQTAAALWFITTVLILASSLIPALAPEDVNFWRLALGVPALAMSVSLPLLLTRVGDRAFLWWIRFGMTLAIVVYVPLLQITPATIPLLFSMLVGVIYAGFFLSVRFVSVMLTLATAVALSTLITPTPSETPHLASWLAVYIPSMWAIAAMLKVQRFQIQFALDRARRQARIDPLTGLANLRSLSEHAESHLTDEAEADNQLHALMLIDLDNFKAANTLHGHVGGDRALRRVGKYLHDVAPKGATVARIGGDEFAVLLSAGGEERLMEIAEVFRSAVIGANVDLELDGVTIDASVGVAQFPKDGRTLDELLTTADIAMYEKKSERPPVEIVRRPLASPTIDPIVVPRRRTWFDKLRERHTDYAITSTAAWVFGTSVVAVSMMMPGAFDMNVPLTVATLIGGYLIAWATWLLNVEACSRWHMFFDFASMGGILLITVLTGGVSSPAMTLLILQVTSQAWFWRERNVALRVVGPLLVILLTVPIDLALGRSVTIVDIATVYAVVSVVMVLTIVMYFNQRALGRLNRRASRLALTDPLTGVPNRRAFEIALKETLAAGDHSALNPLAIVMIDLDDFKSVNTNHGHRTGDIVLTDIAASLESVARGDDLLARIGGDEFAALLPGVDVDGARTIAERFINAVETTQSAQRHGVGASAGFALCPLHGSSFDELIAVADGALMAVKSSDKGSTRVGRIVSAA